MFRIICYGNYILYNDAIHELINYNITTPWITQYGYFKWMSGYIITQCSRQWLIRIAGVRAQLTALSSGLKQATSPTCATWSGSEGHCMVE